MTMEPTWPNTPISPKSLLRVEHPRPIAEAVESADGAIVPVITNDSLPPGYGAPVSLSELVVDLLPALSDPARRMLFCAIRVCRWSSRKDRKFEGLKVRHKTNGEYQVIFSPVKNTRGNKVWAIVPAASFTPTEGTVHDWKFRSVPQTRAVVDKIRASSQSMGCHHFDDEFVTKKLEAVKQLELDSIEGAVRELAAFGIVRRYEFDGSKLRMELNPELLAQVPVGMRTILHTAIPEDAQTDIVASSTQITFDVNIADAEKPRSRLTKGDLSAMVLKRDRESAEKHTLIMDVIADHQKRGIKPAQNLIDYMADNEASNGEWQVNVSTANQADKRMKKG